MFLVIIEECKIKGEEKLSERKYVYKAKGETLCQAIKDYDENFDPNNIVEFSKQGNFEGECLQREVTLITKLSNEEISKLGLDK